MQTQRVEEHNQICRNRLVIPILPPLSAIFQALHFMGNGLLSIFLLDSDFSVGTLFGYFLPICSF